MPDTNHPDSGERVVVLAGSRNGSPLDWLAVADVAALAGSTESPRAILLDVRAHEFALRVREADVLATGLAAYPLVAILADPGVSYGCARMVCAYVDMRGSPAAAFFDEAEAWRWLSVQLGVDLEGGAAAKRVVVDQ